MESPEPKPETAQHPVRRSWETIRAFALAILLALGIRSFVVEPFTIPSGSMIATLLVGDFILVNKFTYGVRLPVTGTLLIPGGEPRRGDIMVFRYPDDPTQDFIKRVIGVPGDRIDVQDGRVSVNGQLLDRIDEGEYAYVDVERGTESLAHRYTEINTDGVEYTVLQRIGAPSTLRRGPWRVPEGSYFMMGDNRDNSRDSRYWRNPFVRADQIKGKAMIIHWSWVVVMGKPWTLIDTIWRVLTFQVEEIRWSRIGRRLEGKAD